MKLLFVFLALAFVALADNYAVIVSGSSGYSNYRHQSDVYHAVQMLRQNGYSDSHIIVMQEDDVPRNPRNPFPNVVYNNPQHINYYVNIPKDYVGTAVTASNFLAVLSGRKEQIKGGSGKVLETNENDNILWLYFDHGAPGLVAFPHGGYLYVKPLKETVEWMFKNKKYNKMVFYIEACESGSMFNEWSDELAKMNVYVTTAANPVESSYAHYWDSDVSAYLGDLYSITYMEDIDENGVDGSLDEQFKGPILKRVTRSHPQQYGNMEIAKEPLRNFFAGHNGIPANVNQIPWKVSYNNDDVEYEQVNIYDLKLNSLQRAHDETPDIEKKASLARLIRAEQSRREWTDDLFTSLVELVAPGSHNVVLKNDGGIDHECYQEMVEIFTSHCGVVSDYGMQYLKVFKNFCDMKVDKEILRMASLELCH